MPPTRPHGAQGTGHTRTAAQRGPGDRPRSHGGHTRRRGPATPSRRPHAAQGTGHPPRWSHGAQGTCQAPTAAPRGPGDGQASTTATRGSGNRPRPHGGHTGFSGQATHPQRPPPGAQETSHAFTVAIQGPEDRPRLTAATRRPGDRQHPPAY